MCVCTYGVRVFSNSHTPPLSDSRVNKGGKTLLCVSFFSYFYPPPILLWVCCMFHKCQVPPSSSWSMKAWVWWWERSEQVAAATLERQSNPYTQTQEFCMHKTCRGCPKKLPDVFEALETSAAARDSSHPHSDLPGLHPKRHPIPDIIHYFLPGPITFWSKVLHKI